MDGTPASIFLADSCEQAEGKKALNPALPKSMRPRGVSGIAVRLLWPELRCSTSSWCGIVVPEDCLDGAFCERLSWLLELLSKVQIGLC